MECLKCKFTTTDIATLRAHTTSHRFVKPFECTVCHFTATRVDALYYHLWAVHKKTLLTCEKAHCSYLTVNPSYKQVHQAFHVETIHCHICNEISKGADAYMEHQKHHSRSGTFGCSLCSVKVRGLRQLQKHVASHKTRDYEFRCQLCKRSASDKTSLIRHTLTDHAGK